MGDELGISQTKRQAPTAFARRPRSLREISNAGDALGLDIYFEPQYQWIAEEYLVSSVPRGWSECLDPATGNVYYYNNITMEALWNSPMDTVFRRFYKALRVQDEQKGKSIFGLASRALKRAREREKKDRPPEISNPSSPSASATDCSAFEQVIKDLPDRFSPTTFKELAEYFGIKSDREYHLLPFVSDYLDKVSAGFLPEGWQYCESEEGKAYYFNANTNESVWENPILQWTRDRVEVARKEYPEGEQTGGLFKGLQIDQWWAFWNGKNKVLYYNFKTDQERENPPRIGEAVVSLVQRNVRRFLAQLRLRKNRRKKAAGCGGGSLEEKEMDKTKNVSAIMSEEALWRMEKNQLRIKGQLELMLSQHAEMTECGISHPWGPTEHQEACDLLIEAVEWKMDDPEHDLFHLNSPELLRRLQVLVEEYEVEEAQRRAQEKLEIERQSKLIRMENRSKVFRDFSKQKETLRDVADMWFTEAIYLKKLNSRLADVPEFREKLVETRELLSRLEAREQLFLDSETSDAAVSELQKLVSEFGKEVKNVHAMFQEEYDKRHNAEEKKRLKEEKKARKRKLRRELRARERETADRELLRIAVEDRLSHEVRREEMKELRLRVLHAEEEAHRKIRAEHEEARKRLEELEKAAAARKLVAEQEAARFKLMMEYATKEERELALKEEQEKREKEAREAAAANSLAALKREKLEAEMKVKEAEFERRRERMEKLKADQKEAVERARREKMEEERQFQAEKRRQDARAEAAAARKRKRELEIKKHRALLDEDSSDDEAEIQARENAKEFLETYQHNVFYACRRNDLRAVRNFALVEGTAKLLSAHDKDRYQGSRTLLHTACWYGCMEVLEFLLQIGANVNAVDTSYNRVTPLLEAARAGRRFVCEMLLKHGADIRATDCQGWNLVHWAAARAHGTVLLKVLEFSEKIQPGSTKDLIFSTTLKKKTALQLAKSITTKEIVKQLILIEEERKRQRGKTVSKMKQGLFKAKILRKSREGAAKRQAQRLRYGKVRTGAGETIREDMDGEEEEEQEFPQQPRRRRRSRVSER